MFLLIFVVICGAAANAFMSNGNLPFVTAGGTPEAHTSAFYFKAPVLRLAETSNPNTSFLVISNQEAIVDSEVYGNAVYVETKPAFKINVLRPGQAQIHLSARLQNGKIKTITCTVVVSGTATDPGNTQDPSDDDDNDETLPITGDLLYTFETPTTIAFRLIVSEENVFLFKLHAQVMSGTITVGIIGNVARITHRSANQSFQIRFTATINGEVVATEIVTK